MSELKNILPPPPSPRKKNLELVPSAPPQEPDASRQRGLMAGSLFLLLLALTIVLWHDRDFWFLGAPDAESSQAEEHKAASTVAPAQPAAKFVQPAKAPTSGGYRSFQQSTTQSLQPPSQVVNSTPSEPVPGEPAPPGTAIISRTVLPPLEVEVVAGDTHRTVRPGSNSVRVNLQPDTPASETNPAPSDSRTAASVTSDAAERVQMSSSMAAAVTQPARPNYPLLARQMKVQGSVILRALISKDGSIQDLSVVSGPHILAAAAEDAVRQWHFKPHYQGNEAVETQAKITVNFTISTN
jgi:TonB family protein